MNRELTFALAFANRGFMPGELICDAHHLLQLPDPGRKNRG